MSGYVVSQRWRPLTGSRYEITYISARTDDNNEISTANPTFSRFSNSVRGTSPNTARRKRKSEIQGDRR